VEFQGATVSNIETALRGGELEVVGPVEEADATGRRAGGRRHAAWRRQLEPTAAVAASAEGRRRGSGPSWAVKAEWAGRADGPVSEKENESRTGLQWLLGRMTLGWP
jgi:hypothetical protein